MRKLLFIIFLISNSIGYAQSTNKSDYFNELKQRDVSYLFIHPYWEFDENQPIGYIGNNFERLRIKFISVIKNPLDPTEYLIYGKSKVKNNICSFQGKLTIDRSITFNEDDDTLTLFGELSGHYTLFEDQKQPGTGMFKGVFETYFRFEENNEIVYGSLTGNLNNQFEGNWTNYKTLKSIKCNWGDYRIPDSKNLDIGEGEFVPSENYKNFGWESYLINLGKRIEGVENNRNKELEAIRIEKEKWWIENK
jgi:hypothetical protein